LVKVKSGTGCEFKRALKQEDRAHASFGLVQRSTPAFGEDGGDFTGPVTLCPAVDPSMQCLDALRDGGELFQMGVASATWARLSPCPQQPESVKDAFVRYEFAVFLHERWKEGLHDQVGQGDFV